MLGKYSFCLVCDVMFHSSTYFSFPSLPLHFAGILLLLNLIVQCRTAVYIRSNSSTRQFVGLIPHTLRLVWRCEVSRSIVWASLWAESDPLSIWKQGVVNAYELRSPVFLQICECLRTKLQIGLVSPLPQKATTGNSYNHNNGHSILEANFF